MQGSHSVGIVEQRHGGQLRTAASHIMISWSPRNAFLVAYENVFALLEGEHRPGPGACSQIVVFGRLTGPTAWIGTMPPEPQLGDIVPKMPLDCAEDPMGPFLHVDLHTCHVTEVQHMPTAIGCAKHAAIPFIPTICF